MAHDEALIHLDEDGGVSRRASPLFPPPLASSLSLSLLPLSTFVPSPPPFFPLPPLLLSPPFLYTRRVMSSAIRSATKFVNVPPSAGLSVRGTIPASRGLNLKLLPSHDAHHGDEANPSSRVGQPARFALNVARGVTKTNVNGKRSDPFLYVYIYPCQRQRMRATLPPCLLRAMGQRMRV